MRANAFEAKNFPVIAKTVLVVDKPEITRRLRLLCKLQTLYPDSYCKTNHRQFDENIK